MENKEQIKNSTDVEQLVKHEIDVGQISSGVANDQEIEETVTRNIDTPATELASTVDCSSDIVIQEPFSESCDIADLAPIEANLEEESIEVFANVDSNNDSLDVIEEEVEIETTLPESAEKDDESLYIIADKGNFERNYQSSLQSADFSHAFEKFLQDAQGKQTPENDGGVPNTDNMSAEGSNDQLSFDAEESAVAVNNGSNNICELKSLNKNIDNFEEEKNLAPCNANSDANKNIVHETDTDATNTPVEKPDGLESLQNQTVEVPETLLPVPLDEDQSQQSSFTDTIERLMMPPPDIVDEDSRSSFSSQRSNRSSKRRVPEDEDTSDMILAKFPAEKLFEYQWPNVKTGDYFFLQEQVSEYLGIKSFKRKYPELTRHPVDAVERMHLLAFGVVTESQCELYMSLTAVRSQDILDLMQKDYPTHYLEYMKVVREREREKISDRNKEFGQAAVDKDRLKQWLQKAMKSAAEFNAAFNRERREERQAYYDLQTQRIQFPANKKFRLDKQSVNAGAYPVALIPGQFQQYYKKYSPQDLNYFPINTVMYGPLKSQQSLKNDLTMQTNGLELADSDSLGSGSDSDSSSESGSDGNSSAKEEDAQKEEQPPKPVIGPIVPDYKPKVKPDAKCGLCKNGPEINKLGQKQELIHCSECDNSGHPTCLDLDTEMIPIIKNYPWQCMECKTCMCCLDPYDEDKMMFCDMCDRGYHTFCVGLRNIPTGRWVCEDCGICAWCSTRKPDEDNVKAQWVHEYQKQKGSNVKQKFLQTLCVKCSSAKGRGRPKK